MAKTATKTATPTSSKKKTHTPAQTHKKKAQQEKKTSASHKADEKKVTTSTQNDEKQKHKEQAKQEAKLMLKAEQAKKDVQKAEQKLVKAQTRLEDARTQQQTLEQKLAELRKPQQEEVSHNGVPAVSDEPLTALAQTENAPIIDEAILALATPFIEQSADTTDTTEVPTAAIVEAQDVTATSVLLADNTVATDLETEQPPAEGRTDIPDASQEQSTPTSTETSGEETQAINSGNIQGGSDNASMPLLSHDDATLPPPLIYEEVIEAAKDDESSDTTQDTSAPESNTSDTPDTSTPESNTSNATNETDTGEHPHRRSSSISRRTRKTTE